MKAEDLAHEHWLETYRSLITIALEGFRYLALVNGGAIVALLTYLGDASGKAGCSISHLSVSMAWFVVGLFSCGAALFCAYAAQLCLLNEGPSPAAFIKSHRLPLYIALFMFVVSLVTFAVGCWQVIRAFS